TLQPGAHPWDIVIDRDGRYAYADDGILPVVYVVDINPGSKTFNTVVRKINVTGMQPAGGLTQMALDSASSYLYVAAPNPYDDSPYGYYNSTTHSNVLVIDVRAGVTTRWQ